MELDGKHARGWVVYLLRMKSRKKKAMELISNSESYKGIKKTLAGTCFLYKLGLLRDSGEIWISLRHKF